MAPRRRDGTERRDALLDAALKTFARHGVFATGIEDIRRAAKASPSSVYHQFDDLADLTLALLERTFGRLFAHLAAEVTKTGSAEAAVRALVRGHLEWILAHPDDGRFMYQATSLEFDGRASAKLQAKKAEQLAPVVEHLLPFIASGQLPKWSPLQLDVVLLGATHESCRRFLAGASLDPEWMRRTLPALAWDSVSRVSAPKKRRRRAR